MDHYVDSRTTQNSMLPYVCADTIQLPIVHELHVGRPQAALHSEEAPGCNGHCAWRLFQPLHQCRLIAVALPFVLGFVDFENKNVQYHEHAGRSA